MKKNTNPLQTGGRPMPKKCTVPLYRLEGSLNGQHYEQYALSVPYLQELQTRVFRRGGSGHIVRVS